jgi:ATP-dependent Clp protease ATP-binding subunit ClpB
MPPIAKLTTKAREALRRAHELAIERGQNHVNPVHLLCALILQEESMVTSILEKMEIDMPMLTDIVLEHIEAPEGSNVLSPSYQIYLTPDLAQILDNSVRVATNLKDEFISTEHLFLSVFDVPCIARDILARFKIEKDAVLQIIQELKTSPATKETEPKKFRTLYK